jgi:hypothetical protein
LQELDCFWHLILNSFEHIAFEDIDWKHFDPDWLAKKAFLRKRGADLVFFPYTQTTSSTKIKGVIEKKLS